MIMIGEKAIIFRKIKRLAALASCALLLSDPVPARDEFSRTVSQPAQPLSEALAALGEEFGVTILAPGELVRGKSASAVSGALTIDAAVSRLLAGTGLSSQRTSNGAIMIQAGPTSAGPSAKPNQGDSDELTPGTQRSDKEIEELVVIGTSFGAFPAGDNGTASPLTTDPLDVPFATVVVPKQLLQEINAFELQDAYDYVSGLNPSGGYGGISSGDFFARGFGSGNPLRNGYRDFGFLSAFDPSYIESVEIVKGPASILYGGQASPGLQVNYVTKKPTVERFAEARLTVGSFDNRRATADLGGAITENERLLFRLNAAWDDTESHRDFVGSDTFAITPVVQWNVSPKSTATFEATYQSYNYVFDRAFPALEESFEIPIERFFGEPSLNDAQSDSVILFADLKHEFNDDLTYHFGISYFESEVETSIVQVRGGIDENGNIERRYETSDETTENFAVRNELFWDSSIGGFSNSLMVGIEYAEYVFEFEFDRSSMIAPINFFDPVYDPQSGEFSPAFGQDRDGSNTAFYWQSLLTLAEDGPGLYKINLMLGGRYDRVDFVRRNTPRFGGVLRNDVSDSIYQSQAGIVYQPGPGTSIYLGWSQSFNQFNLISTVGPNSEPAKFEEGESYEFGVKTRWFDGRLLSTLNFFNTTKTNVLTPDPIDPLFRIQVGEQRSRGVELDLVGELQPGWNLIANYAYTDAEVTEDNRIPVGDTLQNVSAHAAGLWTSYGIQSGALSGLRFGAGVTYEGEREAQLPNTIQIPEYTRFDVVVAYDFAERWNAQLNVNNITDEEYYDTTGFS